jgi:hypothetical protein
MLAFVLALTACGGGSVGLKDDEDTGGLDTQAPDMAPSVLSVERLECTQQQSAGEVWQLEITVDDPQGADTVSPIGRVAVLNSQGGELAAYDLACNDGQCFGSFRADYNGITCALSGSITMRFTVTDEDGNASAPFDAAAR